MSYISLYQNRTALIKEQRQKTGCSLEEAAYAIDQVIYLEAYKAIGYVAAVKFYRVNKGADLKTAVDFMKKIIANYEFVVPEFPVFFVGDLVRSYDFPGDPNSFVDGVVTSIADGGRSLTIQAFSKKVETKTRRINATYTVLNNGYDPDDRNNFIRVQKI